MTRIKGTTCKIQVDTSPVQAHIVEQSLKPELSSDYGQRATTSLEIQSMNTILITINSPDITALRATMNSMIRWIEMITSILN